MSVVRRRIPPGASARRPARRPVAPRAGARSSALNLEDGSLAGPPDTTLATATALLMALGMVFVYSAGTDRGTDALTANLLVRQLIAGVIGCTCMYWCSRVTLSRLDQVTLILVGGAILANILVLVPGVGHTVKGATRWLRLGPASFQPSEVARIAAVLYAARFAARSPEIIRDWRTFWRGFDIPLVFATLVYFQRDLDTALFMLIYPGIVYFVAGMPWRAVLAGGTCAAAAAAYYIQSEPYRMKRFTAFLNPELDAQGDNYQVVQALRGLGSGGWFGRGLGGSIQKFGFLPEAHTDFIFAVIGEEGGLVTTVLIVGLFAVLAWRGYRIALGQPHPYARYLAAGITAMITFQALMNLLVVTSRIPVLGIPLPLVSSGGTSLIFVASALGILWGLSRHRES